MQQSVKDMFSLEGKKAVVIGGSGVLGGVFCRALAGAGAEVAVAGRTPGKAQQVAEDMRADGLKAIGINVDASDRESVTNARDELLSRWDGVDILINAPGINSATPFFEIEDDEWHNILDANLKSVYLACQIFGESMTKRGTGSIINISSVSSGPPLSRVFTYSISKAGVDNLTQWLAREFAPKGVRVNAIIPGFFPAEQNRRILSPERVASIHGHTPMGRMGEPEELAGTVVWLASDKAANFVTGALIRVDGGFGSMTI